jgi:hypothetical protein
MSALEQFNIIKQQHTFVVSVYFRGDWCPWCSAYLSDINSDFVDAIRALGGEVVGITSQHNSDIANTLDLRFKVLSDPTNSLAKQDGVFLTPKTETPFPDGEDYNHGMAQPAVIAKTVNGESLYEWIIIPSEMNFGGATDRPLVATIQADIVARLNGQDVDANKVHKGTDMEYLQANHPTQYKIVQDYLASIA